MTENILDKIIKYHHNPTLFTTSADIQDSELNMAILGKVIEEDDKAWWIKNGSEYIFYCRKEAEKVRTNRVGIPGLEIGLQELWGRYTKKQMADFIYAGYKV